MTPKPRAYQEAGIEKLAVALTHYRRAADFSDTGTGKTWKTAFILRGLNRQPIIVCPRIVVPAWEEALALVGVEPLEIITYDLARNGKSRFGRWKKKTKRVKVFEWKDVPADGVLVFDEVQYCKGQKTLNSKLLVAARQSQVPTLVLSATPAKDPTEMKALAYVLGLTRVPSMWWHWALDHGCYPGPMGGLEYAPLSNAMERIHRELEPIMDRVRKDEVPEFPEVDNQIQRIPLPKGETLDKEYHDYLETLKEDADTESVEALRIRQIIEHKKLSAILELCNLYVEGGNSVIVFLQFRKSIETLLKNLPDASVICGGIPERERNEMIAAFQENRTHVVLVQLQAGGAGVSLHDLHGRPRIALLCPTGSATLFYQATGRGHRDGAKSKMINKMLIAKGTREEKLVETLEQNRNSLHQLTDGDLIPV